MSDGPPIDIRIPDDDIICPLFKNEIEVKDLTKQNEGFKTLVKAFEQVINDQTKIEVYYVIKLCESLENIFESNVDTCIRLIIYLVQTAKAYSYDISDYPIKACDRLFNEGLKNRNERHLKSACRLLTELAVYCQTDVLDIVHKFLEHLLSVIRDPKYVIRIEAAKALSAVFALITMRENKDSAKLFDDSLKSALHKYKTIDNKKNGVMETLKEEDFYHSKLLIINEIFRVTIDKVEKLRCEWKGHDMTYKSVTDSKISSFIEGHAQISRVTSRPARELLKDKDNFKKCVSLARACCESSSMEKLPSILIELIPRMCAFEFDVHHKNSSQIIKDINEMINYIFNHNPKLPDSIQREKILAMGLIVLFQTTLVNEQQRSVQKVASEKVYTALQILKNKIMSNDFQNPKNGVIKDSGDEIYKCLAIIISAMKEDVALKVKEILVVLFKHGLCRGLVVVSQEVVQNIPSLKEMVKDNLLELICRILLGHRLPERCSSEIINPPDVTSSTKLNETSKAIIALETLGLFDFDRHVLQYFTKYLTNGYLMSNDKKVQIATVKCCSAILRPFVDAFADKHMKYKREVMKTIKLILNALIKVAVSHTERKVRQCVLNCFLSTNDNFLYQLAHEQRVKTLALTLNDQDSDTRNASVALFAKLSQINPGMVYSRLRTVLMDNLSLLEYSTDSKTDIACGIVIAEIAERAPAFIKPYIDYVIKMIVRKLKVPNIEVDVLVALLNALAALCLIGGIDVVKNFEIVFPELVNFLSEGYSLGKRSGALKAMTYFCQSTAYVIDPYRDYPSLLPALFRHLKMEASANLRRQILKSLGTLGAIDPYMYKVFTGEISSTASKTINITKPVPKLDGQQHYIITWMNYEKCTLDEFYPSVAIAAALHQLSDESQGNFRQEGAVALQHIFEFINESNILPLETFVPQVIPKLIEVIGECQSTRTLTKFIESLGNIVAQCRKLVSPYTNDIFYLLRDVWGRELKTDKNHTLRGAVVEAIGKFGIAIGKHFTNYVNDLAPFFTEIIQIDMTSNKGLTKKALICIQQLSETLEPTIHLILPNILSILDKSSGSVGERYPKDVRKEALKTLITLAEKKALRECATMVIQAWLRNVDDTSFLSNIDDSYTNRIRELFMILLLLLARQLWVNFDCFRSSVEEKLDNIQINKEWRSRYNQLMKEIEIYQKGIERNRSGSIREPLRRSDTLMTLRNSVSSTRGGKLSENETSDPHWLYKLFKIDMRQTREEWLTWLDLFKLQFMKYSPSPAFRACHSIAYCNPALAKELFNGAFVAVWDKLSGDTQTDFLNFLVQVLKNSNEPEIILTILNLREFIDHCGKISVGLDKSLLRETADSVKAYAKALRYKELEIRNDLIKNNLEWSVDIYNVMISYGNKLNCTELALGMTEHARKRGIRVSGIWHEKLLQWEEALKCYGEEVKNITDDDEIRKNSMRQMRCYEALSQWQEVDNIRKKVFTVENIVQKPTPLNDKVACIAARCLWTLGSGEMDDYIKIINENTIEGSFLRAVSEFKHEKYDKTLEWVQKTRDMLDSQLATLAAESYERAYPIMLQVQQLTELEEAVEFKLRKHRRDQITVCWSRRFQGCKINLEDWQKLLLIRSLVLSEDEMFPMLVKYANLCRTEGKHSTSRKLLYGMCRDNKSTAVHRIEDLVLPLDKPPVVLSLLKTWKYDYSQLKDVEKKKEMQNRMLKISSDLTRYLEAEKDQSNCLKDVVVKNLAKTYVMSGDWISEHLAKPKIFDSYNFVESIWIPSMGSNFEDFRKTVQESIRYYGKALEYRPNWYKAAHKFAETNYLLFHDLYVEYKSRQQSDNSKAGIDTSTEYSKRSSPQLRLSPTYHLSQQNYSKPIYRHGEGVLHQYNNNLLSSNQKVLHLNNEMEDQQPQHQQPSPIKNIKTDLFLKMCCDQYKKVVSAYAIAINASDGSCLQDLMRYLIIISRLEDMTHVKYDNIWNEVNKVQADAWCEVIPQLISKLDKESTTPAAANFLEIIKNILIKIGRDHPQAIIYPLVAASKSRNKIRKHNANTILHTLRTNKTCKEILEHALIINTELTRVAVLWPEQFHDSLEEASKCWFQDNNFIAMKNVLEPLHKQIQQDITTLTQKEQSFVYNYKIDLDNAWSNCLHYENTKQVKHMHAAWDLYYNTFKKLTNQLRNMQTLDMKICSPDLIAYRNFNVVVPGTYNPYSSKDPVMIKEVKRFANVISSKQRPRKVIMIGSDGEEYCFLLKGHEDPRQDERVMQLFGLINTLFNKDRRTYRRNLDIQRYSIIALNETCGLIGWLPNCDTLHSLIKDFRDKGKINISAEHTAMQSYVIDLEKCNLMMKVEAFKNALTATSGEDLRQTLWLKSPNSEIWFERRTNYTRSMAVMSMVGYLIGLGDRHPSNLMLDRLSGKIVHIDFGDLFEIATMREKYPEKIPFRLTRIMVRAMEVTGIEGNYRNTCERVLNLCRTYDDRLLAILEAFVYDPVIGNKLQSGSKAVNKQYTPPKVIPHTGTAEIERIKHKLIGRDFAFYHSYEVEGQVNRLIEEATSADNLCQCYVGWCPFW
uniref:Serine/threonine-protein kinase TOR n=1 Tax=Strongyloides venezuelensis TaxID=75913 RepID=A0A0K0F9G1_STRVS